MIRHVQHYGSPLIGALFTTSDSRKHSWQAAVCVNLAEQPVYHGIIILGFLFQILTWWQRASTASFLAGLRKFICYKLFADITFCDK